MTGPTPPGPGVPWREIAAIALMTIGTVSLITSIVVWRPIAGWIIGSLLTVAYGLLLAWQRL
jgi:hypothetical protein